ncbi:cysteine desulfhydrase [Marinomonas sp. THO17]|uniref:1-aminocyclopropane-1-carboxylate deaminase/D-cysteine desulfhydrase n=1 Tax=Marinomonas sp. THO17 TaxID=3149048 RepID=UPI00336BC381
MPQIQALNLNLKDALPLNKEYQVHVYRGDLEHVSAPGNKWHKLKHHLQAAKVQGATHIGTFGGPFSNHLDAVAATLADQNEQAVLVVRGELQPDLTPTLQDAVKQGAELWPSTRQDYRLAMKGEVVKQITHRYPNIYWVPEGGGGALGAKGCSDWAKQIATNAVGYDAWTLAAGTGTTAAGFLASQSCQNLHVFSALKGAQQQASEIVEMAKMLNPACQNQPMVFHSDCHQGGYAKHSPELISFLHKFAQLNPDVTLDPVYTCKSLYAIYQAMLAGRWPHQKTLLIHTGGMQGWRGYADESNPFSNMSTDDKMSF